MYRFTHNPPSRQIAPVPALAPSERALALAAAAASKPGRRPAERGADYYRPAPNSAAILQRIEQHLTAAGVGPAAFGRKVANDPGLVRALRGGRTIVNGTAAKVDAYFASIAYQGEAAHG